MSITVNISGTFSEKQRPNNGLEAVAEFLNHNRLVRVPIVGYVEWHTHGESRTGEKMAVVIPAIEPGMADDGSDPDGLGAELWRILDQLRRRQQKGAVADTLFSLPSDVIHNDGTDGGGELEGQMPLVPDVRIGSDGPHEVPPASGEELTAELDERRKATGPTRAEQESKADLRRRVTGSAEPADPTVNAGPTVPVAVFTGNTE